MSLLRWIVSIAGVALIAAIYIWDRRNRRSQPSDRFDARAAHALELPDRAPRASVGARVPELDETVVVRTRESERSETITASDIDFGGDDLPPMHVDAAPVDASASRHGAPMHTEAREGALESHLAGISTGSFIAMQAQAKEQLPPVSNQDLGAAASAPTAPAAPDAPVSSSRAVPKKPPASRKIVALRLSAGSERVEGSRLKSLLEDAGLRHGKYSIYHRLDIADAPLFSVASMVEPGTFDPFAMNGVQFPGVTIFTQLPGPIDGGEMFAQMLACARELERGIGGLLQDERGLPLTEQREQRLRDDVANFVHLLGQT